MYEATGYTSAVSGEMIYFVTCFTVQRLCVCMCMSGKGEKKNCINRT